jgi:hypothetical protein
MRTVILFGLMCIAFAIGNQTGWLPGNGFIVFLVFSFAFVLDIIDLMYTLYKGL